MLTSETTEWLTEYNGLSIAAYALEVSSSEHDGYYNRIKNTIHV